VSATGPSQGSTQSATGGIGAACGAEAETADEIAGRILAGASSLGLNDNATIAAALWR